MSYNPKSASADSVSDVNSNSITNPAVSPTQLPIRGEKRIIPSYADTVALSQQIAGKIGANISSYDSTPTTLVGYQDFYITAAEKELTDYITIRLPARGLGTTGQADGNPAVYQFLINPAQVQVQRTTLDGQAMTRAGWQLGVWGEDTIQISLVGKTAGEIWAFGLTDKYRQFSASYRNLLQLQMVFENNGYWFEGEAAGEGPLAADFTRRRIKMHADVELTVGNFIWSGMFETLTISENAEEPFLASFNIVFTAWKERFRKSSPYRNQISNDVQRGHAYSVWKHCTIADSHGVPANAQTPTLDYGASVIEAGQNSTLASSPKAPAVTSAWAANTNLDSATAPTRANVRR